MGILEKSRSGDFVQNVNICQNSVLTNRIKKEFGNNEKSSLGNVKKQCSVLLPFISC